MHCSAVLHKLAAVCNSQDSQSTSEYRFTSVDFRVDYSPFTTACNKICKLIWPPILQHLLQRI